MSGLSLSTATDKKNPIEDNLPPKIRMVVNREDALFWHYKVSQLESEVADLMQKRRHPIFPYRLKAILEVTREMRDWLDGKGL